MSDPIVVTGINWPGVAEYEAAGAETATLGEIDAAIARWLRAREKAATLKTKAAIETVSDRLLEVRHRRFGVSL